MKAHHLTNQNKLTKWLLMLTLLCCLFAALGGDISIQGHLKPIPKTELALAAEQLVNPDESLKEKPNLSRFGIGCKLYQLRASVAYNEWIRHQIKVFYFNNFTCIRSSQFIQFKTFPANSNEPFSTLFRG